MKVYFSHTGLSNYLPVIEVDNCNTLIEIINKLNQTDDYNGIKSMTLSDNGKILSSVRVFANIEVIEKEQSGKHLYSYYENESSVEIKSASQPFSNYANLLISYFYPKELLSLVREAMTGTERLREYTDEIGSKKTLINKPIILDKEFEDSVDVFEEDVYEFKTGETTLEALAYEIDESVEIEYKDGLFYKEKSKLIPKDMVEAIRDLWDLPKGIGSLRLFQEDALFFIMAKLLKMNNTIENQLLLSMPTGGGKTEAFMIPLLANIYRKKVHGICSGIQSLIIYPTNALANDQAMRFVELIYKLNKKLSENNIPTNRHITLGILSGDTSKSNMEDSLIRICPRCGKSTLKKVDHDYVCQNIINGQQCGTSLQFCRLTKDAIVATPPDILITNPDMINYALQSPRYINLFTKKIESIVFDEVHIYSGIFGCHVSHLLRRLEAMMKYKPLYIGMSATIGNAKVLASLLFDEDINKIRYIKNEHGIYQTDKLSKKRLHVLIKPHLRSTKETEDGTKNKYVRTMSVAGSVGMFIGHLIADSHFRKSIIFTNYRSDADDLAGYLKERERLDVDLYLKQIISKLENNAGLTKEDVDICEYMYKWFSVIYNKMQNINPNLNIGWNRGGLEKEVRIRSIHSFSRNNLLTSSQDEDNCFPIDQMVATKTLEVGIDIGDVTTVINSSAPFTINEYVQRIGRAGRKKDSLAITVINPESAIDSLMAKHFREYVKPTEENFEDAPIIINNDIIIERHVKARLLDYLTYKNEQSGKSTHWVDLKIQDLLNNIDIIKNGLKLEIGDGISEIDARNYAEQLVEDIWFNSNQGDNEFDKFISYLDKEISALGTKKYDLKKETIQDWYFELIKDLNDRLQKRAQNKIEPVMELSGRKALYPSLIPQLRGSGENVSLYIGDGEDPVDTVTRQRAFNSLPLSSGDDSVSTTKSGISSFAIRDTKGEPNAIAKKYIKSAMIKNNRIPKYFAKKFDSFPIEIEDIASDFDVLVPKLLRVEYFPSRFYCATCKRGLTKDDILQKTNDVLCRSCGKEVQQLHQLYMCSTKECGKIFDPPIPKMCINPDCKKVKLAYSKWKNNNCRISNEIRNMFKFRLTKDLEWVCMDCGFKINFAFWGDLISHNPRIGHRIESIPYKPDKGTIEDFCRLGIDNPEWDFTSGKRRNYYKCTTREHKRLKTIGTPRVRTISYSYVKRDLEALCDSVVNKTSNIEFSRGSVLQLAREYMRRFSSGAGESETYTLKTEKIREKEYWGNYYSSHLAWIKFGNILDSFIQNKVYSCEGHCASCKKHIDGETKLDLGQMMKPKTHIEEYNFDATTGQPKRPDHRCRYCDKAQNNECIERVCEHSSGEKCEDFDLAKYLRYIVVHTLKHGIIWSLPKYAGVNVSEIKGEVYPNDYENKDDIVLIDNNEGGSGAIILIQKHWNEIWKFVSEIMELAADNKANIILPHTCSRNNSDLCPFIAKEFVEYFNNYATK